MHTHTHTHTHTRTRTHTHTQCLPPAGRLCLQHEDLTQQYLPVFARELEEGAELAVRNNLVVIMCDLCVRYTNMVDCYIPNISSCLRDDQQVIREQTLIMLTNLLQVRPAPRVMTTLRYLYDAVPFCDLHCVTMTSYARCPSGHRRSLSSGKVRCSSALLPCWWTPYPPSLGNPPTNHTNVHYSQ